MNSIQFNSIHSNSLTALPVEYAEVESEANAADHAVVRCSHREVVRVETQQHFSGHTRAVVPLAALQHFLRREVQLSLRAFLLPVLLLKFNNGQFLQFGLQQTVQ